MICRYLCAVLLAATPLWGAPAESARDLTVELWATHPVTHLTATPMKAPRTPLEVAWVADGLHNRALRVEGGAVTAEISTGEFGCYSCALGGAQGKTLFLCVAPDFSAELRSAAAESHVLAVAVDVPG